MHSDDIMEAIEQLQATIYGDPARDRRGVLERINTMEATVGEIRNSLKYIIGLLIAGVLGALLNLVLNASNLSKQLPPEPVPHRAAALPLPAAINSVTALK